MKNKLLRLEATTLTETEIVIALNISHLYYRRHAVAPIQRLPLSARIEIQNTAAHSASQLAKQYRTTPEEIRRALYAKHDRRQYPTERDIMRWLQEHDSIDISSEFRVSKRHTVLWLQLCGWLPSVETAYDKHSIIADIEAGLTSNKEIAARHGCSLAYVYKLANRPRRKLPPSEEIATYATTHSVPAAAKHYKVTPGTIYYHMSKKL